MAKATRKAEGKTSLKGKGTAAGRADLEFFGRLVQEAFRDPEGMPDRLTVLSLSDEERAWLITPKRLELLQVLRDHPGPTVSELARRLGRRLDTVSRDLRALARHGIVELRREGRTKRVRLATDLILLLMK